MEQVYTRRGGPLMGKLANLIETELEKQEISAVYNSQLGAGAASERKRRQAKAIGQALCQAA